jgi:DNA-binding NarL/FixJ family response regulator
MKLHRSKVIIVEDDPLIAEDLKGFLTDSGFLVVGVAHSMEESVSAIRLLKPEAAVLDINLGKSSSGVDLARWINLFHPIPFIYLTSYSDDGTVQEARDTHPGGYVLKPFTGPEIKVSLEIAISNFYGKDGRRARPKGTDEINNYLKNPLTERELAIVAPLEEGLSNQEIAGKLFISENTVKTHLQHIFEKLDVRNRTEAIWKIRQLPSG